MDFRLWTWILDLGLWLGLDNNEFNDGVDKDDKDDDIDDLRGDVWHQVQDDDDHDDYSRYREEVSNEQERQCDQDCQYRWENS